MKKAYLILAHHMPDMLSRLICALDDGNSFFFIHLDARSDTTDFLECKTREYAHFIDRRVRCSWGDFSIVDATLMLIQIAHASDLHFDYYILLSGQDYPLVSNQSINYFLQKHNGIDFQNISDVNKCWSQTEVSKRLDMYRFKLGDAKHEAVSIPSVYSPQFGEPQWFNNFQRLICSGSITNPEKIEALKCLMQPRRRLNIDYMGGSQWFAYTAPTVDKILRYLEEDPAYLEYFKFVHIPDEIFFQTMLFALNKEFPKMRFGRSLTYVNWKQPNASSPATLTDEDFDSLEHLSKTYLFARKFDSVQSSSLLDKLDQNLRKI